MRLWSLHPKYLDTKGLVALWREGLLAKKVLENKTRGYRNHPQLNRFKNFQNPLNAINYYLHFVCDEADIRGYHFNRSKLEPRSFNISKSTVQSGQIEFEWLHLLKKLNSRSQEKYIIIKSIEKPLLHPLFEMINGGIEHWEII